MLNYEPIMEYPFSNVFQIDLPASNLKISPGNKKRLNLTFAPCDDGAIETSIVLRSKIETKDILIKGIGLQSHW